MLCILLLISILFGNSFTIIKAIVYVLTMIFCPILKLIMGHRRKRRFYEEQEEDLLPNHRHHRPQRPASENWTSRRIPRAITAALALLPSTRGAVEPIAIKPSSNKCVRSAKEVTCTIETSTTLTVLPTGQENIMMIETTDGHAMGSLKVTLIALALECQMFTKGWQRSYTIASVVSKRCPQMGSCTNNFCAKVRPRTEIDELSQTSHYPGNFILPGQHSLLGQ
jgi:hypothetical protein